MDMHSLNRPLLSIGHLNSDAGPDSHELLLAAIGACASISCRILLQPLGRTSRIRYRCYSSWVSKSGFCYAGDIPYCIWKDGL